MTLQQIADKAGVSRATVSRALKNHPRIGQATTVRIQELARQMGYQPDAQLAELTTHLRKRRKIESRPVMAFLLWQNPMPDKEAFIASNWGGLWQRAWQSGWAPALFNLGDFEDNSKRLAQILYSRGIRGVVLCPAERVAPLPELNWSAFSVVAIGHSLVSGNLHRCANNYYENMFECVEALHRLGYRRVGLVLSPLLDKRTHGYYPSAYLFLRYFSKRMTFAPLLHVAGEADRKDFLRWHGKWQPDVIICASGIEFIHRWLGQAGCEVPRDIGLVDLKNPHPQGYSGVLQNTDEVCVAAIDLMVTLIQNNDRGLPRVPREIFIKGKWVDGFSTLRR